MPRRERVRCLTLLPLFVCLFLSCPARADLIGHWPADNSADDSLGLHHGTLLNGAGFAGGRLEQAFSFDGEDDAVDLGRFDLSGSALTIAAWIFIDDFDVYDGRIISKADGSYDDDHYWMLSTISSGGTYKLRFRLKAGGSTSRLIASSGELSPGVWTHVAAVYDGAEMRIYKDGIVVGSMAKSGTLDTNSSIPVAIGNNPVTLTHPFDGRIDDLRIYSHAMSADALSALATPGTPTPTPTPSPAPDSLYGYWPAELSADDAIGAHDGVLRNGAGFADGISGQAFSLDGVDDYIDLDAFDPAEVALTIAGWIRIDDFEHPEQRILSKATGIYDADHVWMLSSIAQDGGFVLRFRLRTQGETSTLIASSGELQAGVWTHVAATYDGAAMRLYKDGQELESLPKSGPIDSAPSVPVWIGANPTNRYQPFDGLLDELRLYERALSLQEIQSLAGLTTPTPTPTPDVTATPNGRANGHPHRKPNAEPRAHCHTGSDGHAHAHAHAESRADSHAGTVDLRQSGGGTGVDSGQ